MYAQKPSFSPAIKTYLRKRSSERNGKFLKIFLKQPPFDAISLHSGADAGFLGGGSGHMSSPYVGEIRLVGFSFAPAGWAFCNGATLAISENDTLFNLIGTTFGGDGQSTFNLPDLRGRVVVHQGQGGGLSNYTIGQTGGSESVTLNTQQIPSHNHMLLSTGNAATSANPATNQTLANQNVSQSPNPVSYYAP